MVEMAQSLYCNIFRREFGDVRCFIYMVGGRVVGASWRRNVIPRPLSASRGMHRGLHVETMPRR